MMPKLLLINGPNLARLGARLPEIYGNTSLQQIEQEVGKVTQRAGWKLVCCQSNHEGVLIDFLDSHRDAGAALLNPGALMISGWSLRDALEDFPAPWIEIHLSNLWAREDFRHRSVLAASAAGVIFGLGWRGYVLGAIALVQKEFSDGPRGE